MSAVSKRGGAREGEGAPRRGRPPLPPEERREHIVQVRVTAADVERYRAAGVDLSAEARRAWERAARAPRARKVRA